MKEKILNIMKKSKEYISGEELSRQLGISRTAVWKHIKNLKQAGYSIESKSGLGYCYVDGIEQMNKEELQIIIHELGDFFKNVEYFQAIDSTNVFAKNLRNKENTLIVAKEQTMGRGRLGRQWESKSDQGIYMSLKIHPDLMPSEAVNITQVASLAVARALRNIFNLDFKIKWPNDIVFEGKKTAGILTEMITEIDRIDQLIIGIGINVFNESFEGELKDKAISLKQVTDVKISRLELIKEILNEFIILYRQFTKSRNLEFVLNEINAFSSIVGKDIIAIDKGKTNYYKAEKIDKDGRLIVVDEKGIEKELLFGEISIRSKDGYS
ncbi:MAG: biotin--[acetyl-CoA-carboxylase] ligase [Clostridiales bacterium]|nr:biotin--[acetyl-CoA-carboxylase] ligase [Clostridiales bacterium]